MFSRQLVRTAKLIESATIKQTLLCPLSVTGSRHYIQTMNPCTPFKLQTPQLASIISRRTFSALSESDVLERITKVLGEMERAKMDDSKPLTAESTIADDVGLDSLDFVEFGIALEDEFGIEIDDDKAETIKTVGDCIKLIQESEEAS